MVSMSIIGLSIGPVKQKSWLVRNLDNWFVTRVIRVPLLEQERLIIHVYRV